MQNFTYTLLLAGVFAGLVNFFVSYIQIPFTKGNTLDDEPPKLKDIWWIAIIGYSVIGCAGAFLTPLLNVIIGTGLKGLEWVKDANNTYRPKDPNYFYILFGYGLVFGYSTTRLLVGLVDSLIKKVSLLERRLRQNERVNAAHGLVQLRGDKVGGVIDECESQFEMYKADCSGFVKAVAAAFSVTLTGQADDIVDQITASGWRTLKDGVEAAEMAGSGWLVIAGLRSAEHTPPHAWSCPDCCQRSGGTRQVPHGLLGQIGWSGRKIQNHKLGMECAEPTTCLLRSKTNLKTSSHGKTR